MRPEAKTPFFAPAIGLRRVLAVLVVFLIVVTIAVLVLDLRQQVRKLAASAADNMQWTLGQTEVELMALEIAALRASAEIDPLEEVRLRYDVFYSRVQTLKDSSRFATLLDFGNVKDRIDEISVFRDIWLPVIDGPDAALRAALPQMADEARAARGAVRDATLAGVEFFSEMGYEQRDSLGESMARVGLLTVALLGVLAVLSLALFRLARQSDAEARENRETRERTETILSTAFDAVVVSDYAGRIIEYNGAAERVFGYSHSEAIGADMADLIIPDHFRDAHREGMARFRRGGSPRFMGKGIVRLDAKRRDGSIFPVDVSLARAQSPHGEIYIAFLRDISDRVRSEAALKRARDRAIAGEKQKAELLAVMSHEMRTPLNGMLGTLELVDNSALDKRHQRFLRIVKESGRVLLRHVNEVLDISRLDAGKMSLRKTGFDLIALLEETIDNQRQNAALHGNTLVLVPPNPELHHVHGDPDRLRQILLNLVSNAIKFTRNGRIAIEADCSNGLEAVELRVTDTGIGIAEADLDRIFEDFVTIDSTYGRSTSGTGLGLGISRRLATALDGELDVESEPGDGSVFWLRLPLAPPEQDHPDLPEPESPPVTPSPVPPPCDILLVEDNEINRIVGRELLEHDRHHVETAACGELALKLAEARRYDVVLMDISMPGMDGIDVARAIRCGAGINAGTPIIATTAHALPQEIEAFLSAGMQAVLIKPLTLDAIRKALMQAMQKGPSGPSPTLVPSTCETIDKTQLAEMRRHLSDDRMAFIHDRFVDEMSDFLDVLPDLLLSGSSGLATLASEAHRLSGSSAVLGSVKLTALLRALHNEAQAEQSAVLAKRTVELAACWDTTRAELAVALQALEQVH
ncbi:ATP-binding protein [Antarctobacter sp.]|uniref:ATP-binding protein n=1 Tax=Antarctobacter sp. TaxID=1872577 RepID=UPI002B27798B|nr:ATP-binding protein [Antarctobacter sp.]